MQPESGPYVRIPDVRISVTMLRALRTGLFIGVFLGMSACAATPDSGARGPYGSVEVGRTG
jgi:hypothetical protein